MKPEKIDELYFSDVNGPISIDRRDFIKKIGGGIIVVFCLGKLSMLDGLAQNNSEAPLNFNAYIRVKEDGRIDCYIGKIEMGQGISTSLTQVVAEELEVSIHAIDMIMGDTDLCPYDAGTWGSRTTRFADPVIRAAAAEAREVLFDLAAEKLKISKDKLVNNNGVISDKNNTLNKVTFAQLTEGKKILRDLKMKPSIKKSDVFKIIGKPLPSLNTISKVTGKAVYSADIQLPGMVHATVIRPTVVGSIKVSVDASKLSDFEGVQLVDIKDLVAVVHTDPELANLAARKVKVTWDAPKAYSNSETIFNYLEETLTNFKIFKEAGNLEIGKSTSKTIIKEKYVDGYKAHAPMETHSATCYFEGDKLTIWASTQTPFGLRDQLARALNTSSENIHVKQVLIGGGFGGKIYNDQAIEAALISKAIGKPVQLVWSRKEEFMYDKFRPAAVMNATSGVNAEGKLMLLEFDIYCAGTRGTTPFYGVENYVVREYNEKNVKGDSHSAKTNSVGLHPFGTGAWRAPGNNSTTFARESHIDMMAHTIGMDPLEFRYLNLNNNDMLATLQLAAETFDWGRKKNDGVGYGISLGEDAGTCVAIIAEVSVDKTTGIVNVIKVVCAQDMGQVVNPQGATIQGEGGITMGLGYALYEDVEFNGGNVKTRSFKNYEITRFSKTPKIECVFIDKMDGSPQGGGEPAIICVGGAIANAVFDACGARVNQMPITPERILKALKQR